MKQELSVGVLQLCSTDDVKSNVARVEEIIRQTENIDLWSLPENALFLRSGPKEPVVEFDLDSPVLTGLQRLAVEKTCHIHIGSLPLKRGSNLFNSTVWISPDGISCPYDKIHLFDHSVGSAVQERESDTFSAGQKPMIMNLGGWKIGLSICYDLRFAELFSWYAASEVDLLLVPAAFLVETGKVHWEILLRARAIESQCFVMAAAQSGEHFFSDGKKRSTFGHSMVVEPWGGVLWQSLLAGQDVGVCRLSHNRIVEARGKLPMREHRRLFLERN